MSKFVPLKIAKKLKEKGFKEGCVAHYHSNDPTCLIKNTALADYVQQPFCIESIKRSWNRCELNPCSFGCYYDAPTISQVLKWLRDEKKLYIEPCILVDADTYWSFSIVSIETGDMIYFEYEHIDDKRFETYEQAALAGIEYVLNNLI